MIFGQIWIKLELHVEALGNVDHSLLWAAGLEVAHRYEIVSESFFGGDSLTPINIKGFLFKRSTKTSLKTHFHWSVDKPERNSVW